MAHNYFDFKTSRAFAMVIVESGKRTKLTTAVLRDLRNASIEDIDFFLDQEVDGYYTCIPRDGLKLGIFKGRESWVKIEITVLKDIVSDKPNQFNFDIFKPENRIKYNYLVVKLLTNKVFV